MATSFGPTALATPANAITLLRVLITPVLLAMILGSGASWMAVALWVALAGTDGLDGYLARRMGTTRSGAFLDPLADKFLVLGALMALVIEGTFPLLPVALIAVREVGMSLYRSVISRGGTSVPASWGGKAKTVTQDVAIGIALGPVGGFAWVGTVVLWVATAMTVWTGVQYVLSARGPARAL